MTTIKIELDDPYRLCGCGSTNHVIRRRQNTDYRDDDEKNYVTCCEECFKEIQEYWAERWADYNSGRL